MARINIEDSLFKDKRFTDLCIKLGSRAAALGTLIEAYLVSQEFATSENPRCLIPVSVWRDQDIPEEIFECRLAVLEGEFVYVRGASECHAWLIQKRTAGAKGGRPKVSPAKSRKPKANRGEPKRTEANPLTLTPSLTPTLSSDSSLVTTDPASGAGPKELNSAIWESYRQAYFARYNVDPVRNAKVNAQVAQLGARLGVEAPHVVAFYLTSNKTFYAAKVHELGLCLADAESLRTQWAKGKALTNADLKRFEKSVESNELDRLISEGKI